MLLISNINHGLNNKTNSIFFFSFRLYRYVDLLQMVQPDYSQDHIIILLLKEMEEYADVNDFLIV